MIDIHVTDHALWRFAERVGRSAFTPEIEEMIRKGLEEGRVSAYRNGTPTPGWTRPGRTRLYVWTPDKIVFSLSARRTRFIVRTVLTPLEPDRRDSQWPNGSRHQNNSSHSNGG